MHSRAPLAIIGLTFGLLCGCSPRAGAARQAAYRMGERVQVGPLIYVVLDAEWLDRLGEPPNARLPRQRFLSVRLSITNSGAAPADVPRLSISGAAGDKHPELTDGPAVPEWLGYVRTVKPADTLYGRVVFDAPASDYQLDLRNDDDLEDALFATVELPLQLDRPRAPRSPAAQ